MTRGYLGDSGIVLLAGDEPFEYDTEGVRWQWNGDEPWSPSPAPRTVTGDNANDDGSWDATEFYSSRRYALEGLAHAPDHEALHAAKHRFMAACGLDIALRCVEPGFDRQGQFRRDGEVSWKELTQRVARFSAPLWAADPRAYSTILKSLTVGFPSTSGGMTWPGTWPARWSAVVTAGYMELRNAGNRTAWPLFRIDGPVVNPAIVNADTGQAMRFDITLTAGQWLTIDTRSHQVLANGDPAASRRSTFYGTWWGLPPGLTTAKFMGDSGGAGAQLTATYRDTWI